MIVCYKEKKIKLPDFLIVGAAKSATTSLYSYLKQSSQIFMSYEKEPRFFCFVNNPPNYSDPGQPFNAIWKLEDYIDLFQDSRADQLIGEGSTYYLYLYDTTIENIKGLYGNDYKKLKIVIILRNPVERAYSQFMHNKRDYSESLDFERAFLPETIRKRLNNNWNIFYDYIGFGLYFRQVKAYLNEFPSVKILFYDNFASNQAQVMKELCEFLNVDYIEHIKLERYNRSGVPRANYINKLLHNPSQLKDLIKRFLPIEMRQKIKEKISEINMRPAEITPEQRNYLSLIYKEDISNLAKLLNKDLTPWL